MPRKIGQAVTLSEAYNRPFPTRFRILVDRAKARDGKSQQKIAEELGFSNRQTIGYYYNGSQSPSLETLAKIAEYFNVTSDYLLGLTDALTTDKNLKGVADYTGLSENSIKNLTFFAHEEEKGGEGFKDLLDRLFCSSQFREILNSVNNAVWAYELGNHLKEDWGKNKKITWGELAQRTDHLEKVGNSMELEEYRAVKSLQGFINKMYKCGLEPNDNDPEQQDIVWEDDFNEGFSYNEEER